MKLTAVKQEKKLEDVIAELGLKKNFVAKENNLTDKQMTFVINQTRAGGIYDEYTKRVWTYLKNYKKINRIKA